MTIMTDQEQFEKNLSKKVGLSITQIREKSPHVLRNYLNNKFEKSRNHSIKGFVTTKELDNQIDVILDSKSI